MKLSRRLKKQGKQRVQLSRPDWQAKRIRLLTVKPQVLSYSYVYRPKEVKELLT